MRRRDQRRDEDETRRRFDTVWPAAQPRPPAEAEAWRRYDARTDPPAGSAPDGGYRIRAIVPDDDGVDDDAVDDDGVDDDLGGGGAGVGDDPVGGHLRRAAPGASGRLVLGAFDPGRRGVRALVAVALLVVVVAAVLAWRAQPHAEPVDPASPFPAPSEVAPSATPATIVVAVQGKVAHPGLVRLPTGARVADALTAVGGPLPGVDLSYVNLARKLTDGELIVIGQTPPPGVGAVDPPRAAARSISTPPP